MTNGMPICVLLCAYHTGPVGMSMYRMCVAIVCFWQHAHIHICLTVMYNVATDSCVCVCVLVVDHLKSLHCVCKVRVK